MISICMASYNGEKYIREQIESILPQLSSEDELIISDDASSDATCQIIESFHDARIKLLHHTPCGLIKNFENALYHASGDYIFLSDQDDVWLPGKVHTCMELFSQGVDLVLSDVKVVDEKLNLIFPSYMQRCHSKKGFWHNVIRNSYLGCSMAFHRRILSFSLPFPNKISGHDIWLGLICEIKHKKIEFYNVPLMLYRRHGNNVSAASEMSKNSIWKKIAIHFCDLYIVFLRNLKFN